uniref:Uncharacterized protein n=1 Tax=Arundo donax TaxID=35708 RepID=A0A0A9GIB5_ARUDO
MLSTLFVKKNTMQPIHSFLVMLQNDNRVVSSSFLPKCTENGKKPRTTEYHADEKAEPEIYIP